MGGGILKLIWSFISRPLPWIRVWLSKDFAKESVILLFMQHLDSTLRLRTVLSKGPAPSAFMPLAKQLADSTAREVKGAPFVMVSEAILGTPLTAHILGGSVIGKDAHSGVIDKTAMTERAMALFPVKE